MNDAGFLKQEGLDMELVYIASSPTVARATLTGDIVLSGANSQVQELINEGFYTKLWGKNP
jgi:ABC-type nitrate/sulfonate/bicarbonate transport system substrate-binding protein